MAKEKQDPVNTELLGGFNCTILIVQLACPSRLRGKNSFLLSQQFEVAHMGTGARTMSLRCVLSTALVESKSAVLLIY